MLLITLQISPAVTGTASVQADHGSASNTPSMQQEEPQLHTTRNAQPAETKTIPPTSHENQLHNEILYINTSSGSKDNPA
jgi:hypothetical protein